MRGEFGLGEIERERERENKRLFTSSPNSWFSEFGEVTRDDAVALNGFQGSPVGPLKRRSMVMSQR